MKILRKSHRVSWPPDSDLCQVRLFSSEDCPSQVAPEAQDQLQEKTPWILHSYSVDSDRRPPGFLSPCNANSRIPKPHWRCPPRFVLSPSWQVTAGEESKEVDSQIERESRVLEAVYPWTLSIPSSPSVSADVEDSYNDDALTPIIPLIPIEEDEDTPPLPTASSSAPQNPTNFAISGQPTSLPPPPPPLPSLNADIIAAASAAYTAIMKSKEHGSMIDTNLLIRILTDPKLVRELTLPRDPPPPAPPANQVSSLPSFSKMETRMTHAPAKDPSYYKNLINEHGAERNVNKNEEGYFRKQQIGCDDDKTGVVDMERKMKPCLFFNSSKGCRLGSACTFRHVFIPPSHLDIRGAKKMKL